MHAKPPPVAAVAAVTLGPGRVLLDYPPPRILLAGDADGDGIADILGVYQPDGVVDFMRMSATGKLVANVQARTGLGHNVVAAACGRFAGAKGDAVAVVLPDGGIKVAYDMDPVTHRYRSDCVAGHIPRAVMPDAPIQATVADFDGDGRPDVLLTGAGGKAVVLRNRRGADPAPSFAAIPLSTPLVGVRRIAAGRFGPARQASVVWLDSSGIVARATVQVVRGAARLAGITRVTRATPADDLAVGRFSGAAEDIVIGRRLLPGGDPARASALPNLPGADRARTDAQWLAADLTGRGMDDLLRVQRSSDPLDGNSVYVHYASGGAERPDLDFDDADNDGLPNAWETGRVHPGGLDLAALGCSPYHADIIVEVQPFADVPANVLDAGLQQVKEYFASIPIHNLDGQPGIAIHFIRRDPIPTSDSGAGWQALHEKYHPRSHRGVTHWMLIYKGGGGQSGGWGDGGQSGCYGMPGVFIHELGHQLGLDHTGRWPLDHNPLYHSVMNYVYNYALDARGKTVGYSRGDLCGVVLEPRHLTERIPLPIEKVRFIAGPPYRFHIKPSPDGRSTYVDWNWNGVFGESDIAADINYAYSTTAGERHRLGKAYSVPALATSGTSTDARLVLINGVLPAAGGKAADASVHSLSPEHPGDLVVRIWKGADTDRDGASWTEPQVIDHGITGDPSACSLDGAVWVAYPTAAGVNVRSVVLHADSAAPGPALMVTTAASTQPTIAAYGGGLALLLWRGRDLPVGLVRLRVDGDRATAQPEQPLDLTSNTPVGATAGEASTGVLWIAGTHDQANKRSRWQVHRCAAAADGKLSRTATEWVGGEAGGEAGDGRMSLLWEPSAGLGAGGQLYLFGRGGHGFTLDQEYVASRIADRSVNGGWLTRRFYDEWTNSRLSCSVCWFKGEIAYGSSMFGDDGTDDNNLYVAFHGRGIQSGKMGDFDDVGFIRDYGLRASIGFLTE